MLADPAAKVANPASVARWCVLRTAAQRTLPLARWLGAAGFGAWTPIMQVKRRTRRGSKAVEKRDAPMMPTFVFAPADRLRDLLRLTTDPISTHPPFSVFRYIDRYPLISDGEMALLRKSEADADLAFRKTEPNRFAAGANVQVPDGPLAGLSGVVEKPDGKFALVAFGGAIRWKIGAWLLADDNLQGATVAVSGDAA